MLHEPFHWTWRTPGSRKMGAHHDLLPVATYPVKLWAPALTWPAGSNQEPLPRQREVLHLAAGCHPSKLLELTYMKHFLGNIPQGRWPFHVHEADKEMKVGYCSLSHPPHCRNGECWDLGSSGALLVWSTSWQRAQVLPALVTILPSAAMASSCLIGFSNCGSWHLFGGNSVGVTKGLCLPGDTCLLWFGCGGQMFTQVSQRFGTLVHPLTCSKTSVYPLLLS